MSFAEAVVALRAGKIVTRAFADTDSPARSALRHYRALVFAPKHGWVDCANGSPDQPEFKLEDFEATDWEVFYEGPPDADPA